MTALTNVGTLFYDVDLDTRNAINAARQFDSETKRVAASLDGLGGKLTLIARAIGVYAAAMALVKAAQMADDVRMLTARVQVAAGSLENAAAAMTALQQISARTQTSMEANAQVFQRLNGSILQMGGTQTDTLRVTELLGMAVKVSGASAIEAASAMTQFGQALGSGRLQGDELRSLLENAPYLMRQLADGIGVPVGALRKLGEEGKLTADVVTQALAKSAARIEADFAKVPQTLSGAMSQVVDAVGRASTAFDGMTGGAALGTGILRGLAETADAVARQLSGAAGEADALGRNQSIKTFADATQFALSYVVDAADFVIRGFRQTGVVIYETAMIARAAATGGFAEAESRLAGLKQQLMEIGGAQYAGARIRQMMEALASGTDGSDRLDRAARGGKVSKLTPPPASTDGKPKFDAIAYLAKLREQTANEWDRIGEIEAEALRKNAAQEGLTASQRAQAATLIRTKAAQERGALAWQAEQEADKAVQWAEEREAESIERRAELRRQGMQTVQDVLAGDDPVARLELRLQRESELLAQYAAIDHENAAAYAQARVALEQRTADQITQINAAREAASVAVAAQAAGQLYALLEQTGRERTGLAKTLFAVSKALAVAEIILNTEVAASKAGAQLGIYGIPMATLIRAQGYASAGMVAGMAIGELAGGRQYGGPTSAGSMYRVNEAGRPEMFTASNGAQYMLPTANGRVTAAGEVGGAPTVVIENHGAPLAVQSRTWDADARVVRLAVKQAKDEIADEVQSNRGKVWGALTQNSNVRGVL